MLCTVTFGCYATAVDASSNKPETPPTHHRHLSPKRHGKCSVPRRGHHHPLNHFGLWSHRDRYPPCTIRSHPIAMFFSKDEGKPPEATVPTRPLGGGVRMLATWNRSYNPHRTRRGGGTYNGWGHSVESQTLLRGG